MRPSPPALDLKQVKTNPSTLFGVTNPSATPITAITFMPPKIDRVFATSAATINITYTGTFDFLEDDNQTIFESIFGVQPNSLLPGVVKKRIPVENTEDLKDKLLSFVSLCHLFIFCSIVNDRYVGTSDFEKTQIITDVKETFYRIKLECQVQGQVQTITPDDLYREYQNCTPCYQRMYMTSPFIWWYYSWTPFPWN